MTSEARARWAVALATALACWAFTLALLVALPSLAAAEAGGAVIATPPGSALWWCTAVTLTLQSAALLGVRSRPRAALSAVTGLALLLGLLAPGVEYTLSHLGVLVAVFLAAPRRPWQEMRPVLALTALAVAAGTLANGLRSGLSTMPGVLGEALVQGVGIVGITALVSLSLASIRTAREAQRKEGQALARERDALEREREALIRATASEERAAMARELHDIAAHHLSGIALVAGAADRQIDTDPHAAHESVRQVRAQTRAVLDDIRRVVGLLRDSGRGEQGGQAERSVETLATIPALVEARAAAGMPVRLIQRAPSGDQEPGEGIGPLAQLVAYRMVQESLTNAAEHAPGAPCLVTVDETDPDELVLTVRDEGADPARISAEGTGGYGLVGMRERAGLIDAPLEHGPTADGGWQVRLRIPRDLTGLPSAPGIQEGAR
ncbi:sensor histidine kinase [Brachybacterium sacelli]|uniref:histidine kinase n=1 Tax=Brachybacterium sacelli TaxID=173364 RepID=A0ABS4WWQ8_9MICO|nr:histidine kinase [Brachybacterium sacelli]MBP2380635.1 signal transduction histidine kinase [Brachybacterium sacelli]